MTVLQGVFRRNQVEGIRVRRLPGLLTTSAAIVSTVSLLMLIQTSGVASVGYDIQRLEETRDHWRETNFELSAQIAQLQSLDRVEREAKTRMKMIVPDKPVFVSVDVAPTANHIESEWMKSQQAAPAVEVQKPAGIQAFLAWLASISESDPRS